MKKLYLVFDATTKRKRLKSNKKIHYLAKRKGITSTYIDEQYLLYDVEDKIIIGVNSVDSNNIRTIYTITKFFEQIVNPPKLTSGKILSAKEIAAFKDLNNL
jgi:hypothetical protein